MLRVFKELRKRFDGPATAEDQPRLMKQHEAVKQVLEDALYPLSVKEISYRVELMGINAPECSVSAQIRHLRKPRFGSHKITRINEGNLSKYKLEVQ